VGSGKGKGLAKFRAGDVSNKRHVFLAGDDGPSSVVVGVHEGHERSISVALELEDGEATRDHDVLGCLAEVVVDTVVEERILVHQDDLLVDSFLAEQISNELGDKHCDRDGKEVVQISCGLKNDDDDGESGTSGSSEEASSSDDGVHTGINALRRVGTGSKGVGLRDGVVGPGSDDSDDTTKGGTDGEAGDEETSRDAKTEGKDGEEVTDGSSDKKISNGEPSLFRVTERSDVSSLTLGEHASKEVGRETAKIDVAPGNDGSDSGHHHHISAGEELHARGASELAPLDVEFDEEGSKDSHEDSDEDEGDPLDVEPAVEVMDLIDDQLSVVKGIEKLKD